MGIRVIHWTCRLFLAAIFLFAGYTKTALRDPFAPFEFEMAVSAYELMPETAVIFVARTLPWIEIALGVLLLIGWQLRYFATATALLLFAFVVTMGITFARGIEASCGCFGFGEPITGFTLVRDTLFLVPAFFLAIQGWKQTRQQPPAQPAIAQSTSYM